MNCWRRESRQTTLALLIVTVLAIQWWVIGRAVTPAPDACRYVMCAQAIEREGWIAVTQRQNEATLYPAMIALAHRASEAFMGPEGLSWPRAAQLVAALPLLIVAVATWWAALPVVGDRAAALAGLWTALVPNIARLGGDGLADGWHLAGFAIAWGCWQRAELALGQPERRTASASRAEFARQLGWSGAMGVASGVALMARSEVLTLALFAGAVWSLRFAGRPRRPAPLVSLAAIGLGLLAVWLPMCAVVGITSPREVSDRIFGRPGEAHQATEQGPSLLNASSDALAVRAVSMHDEELQRVATTVGLKDSEISSRFHGIFSAIAATAKEFGEAGGYFIIPLALWGGRVGVRQRTRRFAWIFAATHTMFVFAIAVRFGYVSARHLLPAVLVLMSEAVLGVLELGERLHHSMQRARHVRPRPRYAWNAGFVAVVCVASALPLLRPLHQNRGAHADAARWIAGNSAAEDCLLDTRGIAGLLCGRPTYRGDGAMQAVANPRLAFVVAEHAEINRPTARSAALRALLLSNAELAQEFSSGRRGADAVLVYRWHHTKRLARMSSEVADR